MWFHYNTAVSRCKPPLCYFLHKFSQGFLEAELVATSGFLSGLQQAAVIQMESSAMFEFLTIRHMLCRKGTSMPQPIGHQFHKERIFFRAQAFQIFYPPFQHFVFLTQPQKFRLALLPK
jgi:hypothetical protein